MPTYQYTCTECGEPLEVVQSFSDPALTDCPRCNGRLRKVYSAVGVVFKGSGFYRTDSRAGAAAKSDGAPKADSGAKSDSATSGSESGSGGSGSKGSGTKGSGSSTGSGGSSSGGSGGSGSSSTAAAAAP